MGKLRTVVMWGLLVALAVGIASAAQQPEEPVIQGQVVVVESAAPLPLTMYAITRPRIPIDRVGAEISMDDVVKVFQALPGGDKALKILSSLGQTPIGISGITLFGQQTVLLTPLKPMVSGHPIFKTVYLDLWNIDAFAGYTDLPLMCSLDKAYFLDPTLGWGAPALAGRINGLFQLAQPGWYLFVAKVEGQPTIRFKAYVNNVWAGDFTVTGVGVMPVLANLPAGWCWVRFDQVLPTPSKGAFVSLKAWKL